LASGGADSLTTLPLVTHQCQSSRLPAPWVNLLASQTAKPTRGTTSGKRGGGGGEHLHGQPGGDVAVRGDVAQGELDATKISPPCQMGVPHPHLQHLHKLHVESYAPNQGEKGVMNQDLLVPRMTSYRQRALQPPESSGCEPQLTAQAYI